MRASTEREKLLVKQAEDDLLLDFYVVLSASIIEIDPAKLVKIQYLIQRAEKARVG